MTVILVVLAAWLGASAGFVLGAAWVYRRNLWQTGYVRRCQSERRSVRVRPRGRGRSRHRT